MPIGYLMLLGALVGFATLGIFHKVADHPHCRPSMIAISLFFWGGIFTAFDTSVHEPGGLHFPLKVLVIGGAGGLFSAFAIYTFQTGLKYGKISTSWLVLNLSMSVPILVSILFFHEKLNWLKAIGIVLVLGAIIMMWHDKKLDLQKSNIDEAAIQGQHTKWLFLMLIAFLFNGMCASTQKLLVEAGEKDFTWQFYTILYWTAFIVMVWFCIKNKHLPSKREITTGFVMAIGSVAGNVLITLALGHGVEAAVAFPVGNGGSLTLVVLAGVLFFKERVHLVGRIGIICGVCAILLLIMEPNILTIVHQRFGQK